jgi:hypothetical protein
MLNINLEAILRGLLLPLGHKKKYIKFRSVNDIVIAPANTGKDSLIFYGDTYFNWGDLVTD